MSSPSIYLPEVAHLVSRKPVGPLEELFTVELQNGRTLGQVPGQFVMVSVLGVGEMPIVVTSSPSRSQGCFDICVRRVGDVTSALHRLQPGERIGIRGPFGRGFPLEKMRGKDLLLVGGGTGIFPLRALINQVLDERRFFGRVIILYGAKRPEELLFRDELDAWAASDNVECRITVDHSGETWDGHVGVVTTLFPSIAVNPRDVIAIVCGPHAMYRFALIEVLAKGIPEAQIYLSLERRMKCGVGKCGHCQINHLYCCQHGPVFPYAQIKSVPEAL